MLELKKIGIELDMPASKLKAGNGEGVCTLLIRLCQVSLQKQFRFKKPVIKYYYKRESDDGLEITTTVDVNEVTRLVIRYC